VLDFSLPSRSIFGRKTPLKPNTVERIAEGIRRFWGVDPEPFLVRLRGTSDHHLGSSALPIGEPLPTITGGGQHFGLCQPFVIGQQSGAVARSVAEPLPTAAGKGAISLIQPFITAYHNGPDGHRRLHSLDSPLPALDTSNRYGLCQPFLVPTNFGERTGQRPRTHSADAPLPTVVGSATHGLVEPFLVSYYGKGQPLSVADPLDTITGTDRFGLVTPSGAVIADILFRMLQPHELAAGMGFPAGYVFRGTREQVVKQIGNAVEVNKAAAHLRELLALIAA
jgi:DNA (cytosine-5)-methyltransferase 1